MMGEETARRGGNPGGAKNIANQERREITSNGKIAQVIDVATGERIGVLIAGPRGWLGFSIGFAALVHRGGFEKRWYVAADKMTEAFRHA
jgi:hypothetical protein